MQFTSRSSILKGKHSTSGLCPAQCQSFTHYSTRAHNQSRSHAIRTEYQLWFPNASRKDRNHSRAASIQSTHHGSVKPRRWR